jgi:signal transduction histidine kinase/streptogramin lyase
VLRIYEDREGTLWILTDGTGIKRLIGKTYESYTKENGLSDNSISYIFEDKEGSLWLGTDGAGLNKLQDGKFVNISTDLGMLRDGVFSVTEDASGNIWMATLGGVSEFIPQKGTVGDGTVKNYTTRDGLPPVLFGAVLASHYGGVWVGTTKGVYKIIDGKITQPAAAKKIVSISIDCLMEDHEGNLWVGGDSGVSRISPKGVKNFTQRNGLTSGVVDAVYEDHAGNIWVGVRNPHGLDIIQGDSVKHPTLPEELGNAFAIYEDNERSMWIGTAGSGLYRLKDGKFTSYTPAIGFFDYNVYTILEDQFGYLWMDCNRGIYKVRKKELNDYADGKITHITSTVYTTADGMKSSECDGSTTPAAWKTRSGILCFSTVKGVAMVNPAELKINTVPPAVVVDEALAEGKPLKKDGESNVKAGTEKFEFHYAGISFIGPEKVHYKYKLKGYDNDWVDAGTRRDAYYTNLSPGHYRFNVIAANNDGVWNDTGASIEFYLRPFFYQTGWFLGICIFGFVAVGPGIYLFRIRQLKQRQLELTRLVREKTREIQSEKEKTEQAFQEADQHRHEAEKALKELQEAQHQLVLSEKMASLGQLTAGIAHEIKNPLNFVNNFASLSTDLIDEMKQEFKKEEHHFDAKTKENIEELMANLQQNVVKINEHGKRADSIVKGMLLHSRGKAGERQETDLNALLSEYVNLAYHGMRAIDSSFNVTFENSYDETIGKVNVVPQDLSRAFLNIVNNACYSANEKKKKMNGSFSPTVRVTSKNLEDSFEVRVRDNGSGVPKNVLDKIFNPFFTTKPAGVGTGLGLSLTYDIITQEHKGKIEVNTQEGEFAEFILTIPKH